MIQSTGLVRYALQALLPVECHICATPLWKDPVPFFCQQCWSHITPLGHVRCPRCDRPFLSPVAMRHSPSHLCGPCRRRPPAFTKAWTCYPYQSPLKEAIGQFKYYGKVDLARPLADLVIAALDPLPKVECIIPVPLHPHRLRDREYNQSLLLADRIASYLEAPVVVNTLLRTRHTEPQTTLRRAARQKNLRRTFQVTNPGRIAGKSILLVDDVFTTGTTVNECAKALRKAGSGDVYVLTLARNV